MNEPYFCPNFFLTDWRHKRLNNTIDLSLFEENISSNFREVIGHFDRNKISFRVIKYLVNSTLNEMPTYVDQNIGSFWIAAEMKLMWTELVVRLVWNLKLVWVHFASHVNVP